MKLYFYTIFFTCTFYAQLYPVIIELLEEHKYCYKFYYRQNKQEDICEWNLKYFSNTITKENPKYFINIFNLKFDIALIKAITNAAIIHSKPIRRPTLFKGPESQQKVQELLYKVLSSENKNDTYNFDDVWNFRKQIFSHVALEAGLKKNPINYEKKSNELEQELYELGQIKQAKCIQLMYLISQEESFE